jgi:hypothetical protein
MTTNTNTSSACDPLAALPDNLEFSDSEHRDAVIAFARQTGQDGQLAETLERLSRLAGQGRAKLFRDFAPHSWEFVIFRQDGESRFNGGVIYHGPHDRGGDGGAPTFSVSLTPCEGWSIHT